MILTATVQPYPGVRYSALNDPEVRWTQYQWALTQWMCHSPAAQFIFCENSNYAIDVGPMLALAQDTGKTLEILRCPINEAARGKGYGEGALIHYALSHSHLLDQAEGFYKVTGRLFIPNFAMIDKFNQRHASFFNLQYRHADSGVDTRFFKSTRAFYDEVLRDAYHNVDEARDIALERVFRDRLTDYANKIPAPWPLPEIVGTAALNGRPYPKSRGRTVVRNLLALMGHYDI